MKNPIPKFLVSRLKFVRRGSNCRVKVGSGEFFLESQVEKMRVKGWFGCKTGFAAFL